MIPDRFKIYLFSFTALTFLASSCAKEEVSPFTEVPAAYRYAVEEPCGLAERAAVNGTLQGVDDPGTLLAGCFDDEEAQGILLLQAMSHNRMETFKWLLGRGADPFAEILIAAGSTRLRRLIGFALMHDDPRWVAAILESGVSADSIYEGRENEYSLLYFAGKYGARDTAMVATILDHGADIDLLSNGGESVLGAAAVMLRYDMCVYLIKRGASPVADSALEQPFLQSIEDDFKREPESSRLRELERVMESIQLRSEE